MVIDPIEYLYDRAHKSMFVYVSLLKILDIFLNRRDIFEKLVFAENIVSGEYRSFYNGHYYRQNKLLGVQRNCISLGLYIDDLEICNPLGTSKKIHKIKAVYWILLNLPSEFRSSLHSIQLALLGRSSDVKKFGFGKFFEPLTKELKILEQQGVFVKVLDSHLRGTVFCVCADNLGAHSLAGFQESFQVEYLCRFCLARKVDIQTKSCCNFELRTVEQHDSAVGELKETGCQSILGVKSECSLSKQLSFFHPVTGFPPDLLHDLFEGIVPFELSICLKDLISKHYFTLDTLNRQISLFPYKDSDRVNKPQKISKSSFLKVTIGGNGHENWTLLRLLPLMIGSLVPENDPSWEILMDLKEIVELVVSSTLSDATLSFLQSKLNDHRELLRVTVPDQRLRPKHHYVEHYPHLIQCFGPLVELWTMRFESKHSYFKKVVHEIRNFKNILLSLATKHQLMMAHYLSGPSFFPPSVSVQKIKTVNAGSLDISQKMLSIKSILKWNFCLLPPLYICVWDSLQGRHGLICGTMQWPARVFQHHHYSCSLFR